MPIIQLPTIGALTFRITYLAVRIVEDLLRGHDGGCKPSCWRTCIYASFNPLSRISRVIEYSSCPSPILRADDWICVLYIVTFPNISFTITLFSKYIFAHDHPGHDCQSLWNLLTTLSHLTHIVSQSYWGSFGNEHERLVVAEDVSLLVERSIPPLGFGIMEIYYGSYRI